MVSMVEEKIMTKSLMIPVERIEKTILLIRGQKVIIDTDFAELQELNAEGVELADQIARNFEELGV